MKEEGKEAAASVGGVVETGSARRERAGEGSAAGGASSGTRAARCGLERADNVIGGGRVAASVWGAATGRVEGAEEGGAGSSGRAREDT